MTNSRLFSLSSRHVTLSTVGVIPRIRALAVDFPTLRFALSLHAPSQSLRERIVPSAKAYRLPALIEAIRDYVHTTGNRVFVEYVMLHGVNDSVAEARELGELLEGIPVTLNLIPWNPVLSPDIEFKAPGIERVSLTLVEHTAALNLASPKLSDELLSVINFHVHMIDTLHAPTAAPHMHVCVVCMFIYIQNTTLCVYVCICACMYAGRSFQGGT
jgi:hypothetical protein